MMDIIGRLKTMILAISIMILSLGATILVDDIEAKFVFFGMACGCSSAFDNIYNTTMTEASCPETKLRSRFMSFAFSSFVFGQVILSLLCYVVTDSD